MLHTVNKSPFENNNLESCLLHLKEGHALLLIEDGVYAATDGTVIQPKLEEAMKTVKVYALKPDLQARGLEGRTIDGINIIDYSGFVDLAIEQPAVQSWL